jgi:hypothetical protein
MSKVLQRCGYPWSSWISVIIPIISFNAIIKPHNAKAQSCTFDTILQKHGVTSHKITVITGLSIFCGDVGICLDNRAQDQETRLEVAITKRLMTICPRSSLSTTTWRWSEDAQIIALLIWLWAAECAQWSSLPSADSGHRVWC